MPPEVVGYRRLSETRPYFSQSSVVGSCTRDASPPPLLTFIRRVVAVVEPPFWYLDPASLASGEGVGVFLQDYDPIPPVLHVEVVAQAITRVGGTWASREGAGVGASIIHTWEAHTVYMGLVYCLDDRQPTPVYCGISTVHAATA